MLKSTKTTTYLIIAMLAWGSVYPISKYLMSDLSPMTLAFFRYLTAIIALAPLFIIDIKKNNKKIDLKSLINLTAAGLAGTAIFAVFLYAGVSLSTASNGSIIINTQPVFTAILAPILIKERISLMQVLGVIIGTIGLVLVVMGDNLSTASGLNNILKGNLLLVCGAVSMSLYGIIIKGSIKKYGSLFSTWFSMMIGTVILFIINVFTNADFFIELGRPAGRDIFLIIYLGSIATGAAYMLFSMALRHTEVLKATAFKFLIPITGVGLSIIFLGERPVMATYAGIFIVIFSIFLIQQKKVFIAESKTRM